MVQDPHANTWHLRDPWFIVGAEAKLNNIVYFYVRPTSCLYYTADQYLVPGEGGGGLKNLERKKENMNYSNPFNSLL